MSQGDLKKIVPGSLEEKEVHAKKKLEKNNTKAWEKLEVKEEECKSKLVLPQPPRLVKRTRRRKVKLPELVEGQPEIRNFLKAAGGVNPKFPKRCWCLPQIVRQTKELEQKPRRERRNWSVMEMMSWSHPLNEQLDSCEENHHLVQN